MDAVDACIVVVAAATVTIPIYYSPQTHFVHTFCRQSWTIAVRNVNWAQRFIYFWFSLKSFREIWNIYYIWSTQQNFFGVDKVELWIIIGSYQRWKFLALIFRNFKRRNFFIEFKVWWPSHPTRVRRNFLSNDLIFYLMENIL